MNPEEEYKRSKEPTDDLVQIYMDWLSERKGVHYVAENQPQYAPIDYAVFRGDKIAFFLEVKFRYSDSDKYQKTKVPISKYTYGYTFSNKYNIKSYLLIKWEDNLGIIDLENISEISKMVARRDRGEGRDFYALYDVNDFDFLPDVYYEYLRRSIPATGS